MNQPALSATTKTAGPPTSRPGQPPIFREREVLSDSYQILGVLGAGGMGQVFEAQDLRLDRKVAVKAAWPGVDPRHLREEARAMAAVRHPCMVTVHAMGVHRETSYVVMERLYGITLDQHLEQRQRRGERFTVGEVVDVVAALADGLAAVHRAGIAHRDVKPQNVMLAPGGRVVLLDFGIVLPEVNVAAHETIEGSPSYMAPEVIARSMRPGTGHLVDLYSLGVVAYEMLTGAPPFDAPTVFATWARHLADDAPDVSHMRPDIPPRLAVLVSELLDKNPARRPQSAESVLWRLQESLTPHITASSSPSAYPPPRASSPAPSGVRGAGPSSDAVSPSPSSSSPSPGFAVLVVDDDPDIASALARLVREGAPDAQVRTARNGEAALEAVRAQPPDLMLLDLDMPGMNGIEVCMYLRGTRLAERCTVVSVSGSAQQRDRALMAQLGVSRFVAKEPEQLEAIPAIVAEVRAAR